MNNLTVDNVFGRKFFRFSDLQSLNVDRYFSCLESMRVLFERENFKGSTPGFYINYITNSEGGDSVRLTYFANNEPQTVKAIQDFVDSNDNIAVFPSQDSYEAGKGNIAEGYGGENLRFRRFLHTYTQIGLDLLAYDILYSRRLVAEYRLTYSPQRLPCKPLFEVAFTKHSNFFNELNESSVQQLWRDLDYWHPRGDWMHMFVNMMLPDDWIFKNQTLQSFFLNPAKKPPITGETRARLLAMFNLDMPDDWNPDG